MGTGGLVNIDGFRMGISVFNLCICLTIYRCDSGVLLIFAGVVQGGRRGRGGGSVGGRRLGLRRGFGRLFLAHCAYVRYGVTRERWRKCGLRGGAQRSDG